MSPSCEWFCVVVYLAEMGKNETANRLNAPKEFPIQINPNFFCGGESQMTKKLTVLLSLVVLVSVLLAACAPAATQAPVVPTEAPVVPTAVPATEVPPPPPRLKLP